MFYYRVYDGSGQLLVSTRNCALAKDVLRNTDPLNGPYHFFVGGILEASTLALLRDMP